MFYCRAASPFRYHDARDFNQHVPACVVFCILGCVPVASDADERSIAFRLETREGKGHPRDLTAGMVMDECQ